MISIYGVSFIFLCVNSILIIFLGTEALTKIVFDCLEESSSHVRQGRAERHNHIRAKVKECIKGMRKPDKNGYIQAIYDWALYEESGVPKRYHG